MVVYTFAKNDREEVRASLDVVEGREVVSLRVFVPVRSGEMVPTPKGLTVALGLLPELVQAVTALLAATRHEYLTTSNGEYLTTSDGEALTVDSIPDRAQ